MQEIKTDILVLNCVSLCKIADDALHRYGHESSQAKFAHGVLEEAEDVIMRAGLESMYIEMVREAGLSRFERR